MKSWAPLLTLVVAACAAASHSTVATTTSSVAESTTTTTVVAATTSTTAHRGPAGRVTIVHDQHVTIDGVPAGDGDVVTTGGFVVSDSTGAFDLSVGSTVHQCLTDHDSALQVLPVPSVLIAWQHGASWCEKSGGSLARFGIGPGLVASMKDPVFAVRIDASGTVLKVDQGFVTVRGANGLSVLVGPGQQVAAPLGGRPAPVVPLVADEEDNTNFPALQALSPAPSFGRPSPRASPALARILQAGILQVQFAPAAPTSDPGAAQFSQDYFDFLSRHWDLTIGFSTEGNAPTPATGTTTVATNPADVRVEPQTAASPRAGFGTPLFTDGITVWRMVGADAGLQIALRNFLVAALGTGDYATIFTQDFNRAPSYGPVAALVAPG